MSNEMHVGGGGDEVDGTLVTGLRLRSDAIYAKRYSLTCTWYAGQGGLRSFLHLTRHFGMCRLTTFTSR